MRLSRLWSDLLLSGFAGISLGSGRTHRARGSYWPWRTCRSGWSGRSRKAAIFYHYFSLILPGGDFDYASRRKLRSNPTKSSSRTTLDQYCFAGLILICTLGSRGRLTLPTIVNSPRVMAAVVISISARAFPPQKITQAVVTAMARMIFASISISRRPDRREDFSRRVSRIARKKAVNGLAKTAPGGRDGAMQEM